MRSFRILGRAPDRTRFPCRKVRTYPWHAYALIGLLGVVVAVGAQPATNAPYAAVPPPPSSAPSGQAAAPAPASPLDQPLQLVREAQQVLARVQDYTCLLVKQERIRGQLLPENLIELKLRQQPFSVYLRWLGPRDLAGQEVCYVAGRNNNMMRVHATGLKGAVGFISIDPRDPRVFEHSHHTITETGISHLTDQLARSWQMERGLNKTQARLGEYEYNKRRCIRVEATRSDPAGGRCPFYRTVAYFDKETHLPIRVEMYDWPRSGGNPTGDLVECYSYINLQFNARLTDAVFNH